MKSLKIFLLSASALFVLAACGTMTEDDTGVEDPTETEVPEDDTGAEEEGSTTNTENVITEEELAEADGQDGRPAYVAVAGVVYDVTDNEAWENGEHSGLPAGQDHTEAIGESPHGDSVLEDLPVVGSYVPEEAAE